MNILFPSSDAIQLLLEAKKDCTFVQGFFYKYEVIINDLSITVRPKSGFLFDPSDIFQLGWYLKEYCE